MGFKKAILVLLLLIFLTMGAASAADTNTTSDNLAANEDTNLELSENDNILSVESNDIISGPGNGSYTPGNGSIVTGGTFSDLNTLIQNAENELILNDDYSYSDGDSDYITISKNGFTIDGNGHTINSMSKSRIFYITAENVVLKNIQFINGSNGVRGGAIHWNGENGTLSNCNFINNSAIGTSTGGGGGAVYINSNCKVVNCNFTNNQVSDNYEGGAIYFYNNGNVTNCNFVNNTGAVYFLMGNGNVTNCNFTNNTAKRYGGAIYFNREGNVTNCNFINNQAHDSYDGGAIRIGRNGIVTNCNFTNNTANFGGAIYIIMKGKVTNSNFIANSAKSHGGAIYIEGKSNVSNCNFTNNTASYYGGAIRFESDSNITNSNFIANSAKSHGGAIYIEGKINVSNCNFTNNTAKNYGGAVYFEVGTTGNITNCNFIKCSAENAKAIYANNNTLISSCNFETQGSESLSELVVGGIISNCTINGNKEKTEPHMTVTVEDITYGENATFTVTLPSDATGILNITVGNMAFTADVSNEPIITKFSGLDIGTYIANITYTGDLKYLPANASKTFTVNSKANKTFTDLKNLIDATSPGDTIKLEDDYTNNGSITADGIAISKAITIDGNGHTLNANGKSRTFVINTSGVTIKNTIFTNGHQDNTGSAIYWSGCTVNVLNCTFINNAANYDGGAIGWTSSPNSSVYNCTFINNTAQMGGGAIYSSWTNNWSISNCVFINSYARYDGGAIITWGDNNGLISNCTFEDNSAGRDGETVFWYNGNGNIDNSKFININKHGGKVIYCTNSDVIISNSNFEDETVENLNDIINGGTVINCTLNSPSTKIDPSMTITTTDIHYGENATINISISNDATGSITITVDNNDYELPIVDGKATLTINNLETGTYTAYATYPGDMKYLPANVSSTFTVSSKANKTFTDLKNLIDTASPGNTIKLEDDYTNDGSITADGITISKAITIDGNGHTLDAKGSSRIFKVNAENVTLKNIIFKNGHGNNGGAIQWMNTKGVADNCTFINCSAENGGSVYWNGENGMINTSTFNHSTATQNGGAIYWNANSGEIANSIFTHSYAQNGGAVYVPENRNVEIKSSIFDNNIAEEESGAVYGGTVDDDCTFKNNTYTPLNTTTIISINETAVYTGNDISITTIVLSQKGGFANTGTVEIYINSKLMTTIPANTQYIHTTGEIGTYQVLAKFIDDSSYNSSSSTSEFTVIPVDIPEEIETSTAGIFTLEFPDDAEGTLTVFIDGTKYKVYDIIGGILKIDLSDKKGKYNITFEYSGDKNYPAFKKDANITVETNPSITASNAKVLYSAGTTYKITVYKNKGILAKSVSVTIKLNNKKLKPIKTNSKGIASFKVTQTPGTYKLKITSLGKTVTKTLTVKHIVTLKTATVKKSAKKLILQATLTKVNKKYLKKKTVTFKFNGKTYKTKTNAKGVAKVTIKSNILKKLKVGKKITYQATYLKDTIKKTTKVKK